MWLFFVLLSPPFWCLVGPYPRPSLVPLSALHLLFSVCSFHPIGLLLLFVQDIGDICLETAKTAVYCKVRNGVKYRCPEVFADVMFAVFTLQWSACLITFFFSFLSYWTLLCILHELWPEFLSNVWYGLCWMVEMSYRKRRNFRGHNVSWVKFSRG